MPSGSLVINREFSFWDLRYYALATLVFILVQSLLIFDRDPGLPERIRIDERKLRQSGEYITVLRDLGGAPGE